MLNRAPDLSAACPAGFADAVDGRAGEPGGFSEAMASRPGAVVARRVTGGPTATRQHRAFPTWDAATAARSVDPTPYGGRACGAGHLSASRGASHKRKAHIHVGQSLDRVQQFLDAHPGVVTPVNQTDARKQLDGAVARLVNAARSLVLAAAPHQAKYLAAKFPPDFFAQLAKGADAVDASPKLTENSDRTRAGATKAIREALRQGRAAIETMHSLVSYLILGNVQLEAEWRAARRVRLDTGVRRQRSETLITSTTGSASALVSGEEVTARAA